MVTWRRRTLSAAKRDAARFGGVVRHWKRNMRPTWWPRVNGLVEDDDEVAP